MLKSVKKVSRFGMSWPLVKKRKNRNSTTWMVDCGMIENRRVRYFFKSKPEAETKAEQLRLERRNVGLAAFSLTDAERAEAFSFNVVADVEHQLRVLGAAFAYRDAVEYLDEPVRTFAARCAPAAGFVFIEFGQILGCVHDIDGLVNALVEDARR